MRVHDSQAYRKMDVTMERISRILQLREILLSIYTGFILVNAAVVCAVLESISGFLLFANMQLKIFFLDSFFTVYLLLLCATQIHRSNKHCLLSGTREQNWS